ncbi:hypothetical protein HanRHA438_Chr13g0601361 [Helianthus annuus]|uniref:Uncharacterized protein n=1 Tax=Helianthus annuus TaxID=4232 RepID=A0A251SST5_HELAN|nr:hypothetical protein HanIR_Chr13g0642901 [Helianthus annuus]KAJ0497921.1 hypothetical protein HanHA89_Chr13g0516531 [Helianthus annuus]KAJ0663928.1 hypothetical protein HanLR1_Chr13g0486431 [Helianthus annuus]KAJ0858469.1 hypothetical protein HanRHA438_Chr13g0601361 [Helianthus annuus]
MSARWYKRRWFYSHGPGGVCTRSTGGCGGETGTKVPTVTVSHSRSSFKMMSPATCNGCA